MSRKKQIRAGIIGCAGTGKSSIARAVAEAIGVGFLEAKSITQKILVRDGYDYCSGIQIEKFLADGGRQWEIYCRTVQREKEQDRFVTDRTVIDLAAYAVTELHDSDPSLVKKLYYACQKHAPLYTHLYLCPWHDAPISGNGKRTLNPWFQFLVHGLEQGIIQEWGLKVKVLKTDGVTERAKEIIADLK